VGPGKVEDIGKFGILNVVSKGGGDMNSPPMLPRFTGEWQTYG